MTKARSVTNDLIFKILDKASWRNACSNGVYLGSPDDLRDGFIHFSAAHQLQATVRKYFCGQNDLLLVAVEPLQLGDALKWEPSRGGDLFPHLYGPLKTSTALFTRDLTLDAQLVPQIPADITTRGL